MTTNNQFTAVYRKTKDWFIAWVEEIPGVNTQGKTLDEARQNLEDALVLTIDLNRKNSRKNIRDTNRLKRELISITLPA